MCYLYLHWTITAKTCSSVGVFCARNDAIASIVNRQYALIFPPTYRAGGRHNCTTYLLTNVMAWPTATLATPTPVCWSFAQ